MKAPGAMTAQAGDLLEQEPGMADEEFLAACEAFLAKWHTMPKRLSDRRRVRLCRMRQEIGKEVGLMRIIAARLRFDPNRFSKLTRPTARTEAAA